MAIQKKQTASAPEPAGLNFLQDDFYSSGFGLPEGDYVVVSADIIMHSGFNQQKQGNPRLGCMLSLKDLHDLSADPRKQFYSFGSKAHLSFAPNATGKGLAAIPGGASTTFNDSTNWAVFRQSLLDCDPQLKEIMTNDISVIEGMWAHFLNIPEPEDRAKMAGNSTGEAAAEPRKPGTIAVVSHIHDEGKPWNNTGGVPATSPFAKATGKTQPLSKPPVTQAKTNGAPNPAQAPAPATTDDDVKASAINGLTGVLEENPNGLSKLLCRTKTLTYIKKNMSDDMAAAVAEQYFSSDTALNVVLGELGYGVNGGQVAPIQ